MLETKWFVVIIAINLSSGAFGQKNHHPMSNMQDIDKANMVFVRYIVDDVKTSVAFYSTLLGFKLEMQPPSGGFAMLSSGHLHLLINERGAGGAGRSLTDKLHPTPGGWNRIQLRVKDIENVVNRLTEEGASFKSEIITGNGGKQVLLEDPSGNLIELFQPFR